MLRWWMHQVITLVTCAHKHCSTVLGSPFLSQPPYLANARPIYRLQPVLGIFGGMEDIPHHSN